MQQKLLNNIIASLFMCLIFIGLSPSVNAQSKSVFLNADGSPITASWQSDARLNSLVKDLHPAVYINEGEVKVREKAPSTLFVDVVSVPVLNTLAFPTSQIEVVTILIDAQSQLSSTIDLAPFTSFERMKYLHIKCSVETTTNALFSLLKNVDSRYRILITVERPS